jgi:cell fate regulator YaaT (PSP1 superfamily)
MPDRLSAVTGVRFRNAGKILYFHSGGMRLEPGEYVVVESSRGPEVGRVVIAPGQVVANELGDDLPPILRLATEDDIRRADDLAQEGDELLPKARALAAEIGFPGHVEKLEFTLDRRRLIVSFSSEERVEYRELVRACSDRFGMRVEARQLGARDRARLAGGYGVCGRELCCSSWLSTFPSISIRMAKEQDLPLNPQKISGLCGRLLCCLSYEEEGYKEMRRTLPKVGQRCSTPTGEGKAIAVNTLLRQVTLLVAGQRIEVSDRDLGTVVRWDPSSRSAEPPPSMSREEALAAGLIVEDEPGPIAPNPEEWDAYDPGPGRGRLPGGGPRKVVRQRNAAAPAEAPDANQPAGVAREPGTRRGRRTGGGRSTTAGTDQQRPRREGQASPAGPEAARSRTFQRSQAPRQETQAPGPAGAEARPDGAPAARRRRRGGRGRGGGQGPADGGV